MVMENKKESVDIYWQAHRGGGAHEAPDNTLAAAKYAWALGGIPEFDVRSTKDEVIVCLHDETPARTTTVPDSEKDRPISTFTYEEIRKWDAGVRFHEKYKGEKIPSIEEVFSEMQSQPERMAYLDLKNINLKRLGELIDNYKVNSQVIFTHCIQENCIQMKNIAMGVRTMQWIGGSPDKIMAKFSAVVDSGFMGLDQVQLHLNSINDEKAKWPYQINAEYIKYALDITTKSNIQLEVLPFKLDRAAIHELLDMGVCWYATDEPAKFTECLNAWKAGIR